MKKQVKIGIGGRSGGGWIMRQDRFTTCFKN